MNFRPITAIVIALSSASSQAFADPVAPAASQTSKPTRDPNQRICQDLTQVGSRLATKRICATRAEWAEMRKRDRETTEEFQRLQGRPCVASFAGKGTGAAPVC